MVCRFSCEHGRRRSGCKECKASKKRTFAARQDGAHSAAVEVALPLAAVVEVLFGSRMVDDDAILPSPGLIYDLGCASRPDEASPGPSKRARAASPDATPHDLTEVVVDRFVIEEAKESHRARP